MVSLSGIIAKNATYLPAVKKVIISKFSYRQDYTKMLITLDIQNRSHAKKKLSLKTLIYEPNNFLKF